MVDGFHIHIQNRTMKPHANVLSGAGRGSKGSDGGGGLANKYPLYNKYILIKIFLMFFICFY
jgi:hypothetical protein